MRYLFAFLALTLCGFGFDYHLEPTEITEGVSCFFGLPGKADEINGGRVVNSCYVETTEGYVVIDSGPTYGYAQQAYQTMQAQKTLPVKYVINTTAEDLHILGNEFYKEQGATLIGPKSYAKLFETEAKLPLLETLPKNITANTRLIALDSYQNNDETLTVGDSTLEIQSFETGDTHHLVVYIPSKKTLFAGNYINSSKKPTWTSHSNKAWEKALATIEKGSWEYLIPAHGVKHKRNKGVLKQTQNYFASLQPKKEMTKVHLAKKENNTQKAVKSAIKTKKPETVAKVAQKQTPKEVVVPKKKAQEEIHIAKVMVKTDENAKTIQSKQSCPAHINYQPNYDIAERQAKLEHKYLLVKIESNGCKPCKELNHVLESNCNIKKIINQHTKMIKLNISYDEVPANYNHMGTPALFLVQPENEKIVMHLEGRIDAQDLEESLKLFTNNGLAMR